MQIKTWIPLFSVFFIVFLLVFEFVLFLFSGQHSLPSHVKRVFVTPSASSFPLHQPNTCSTSLMKYGSHVAGLKSYGVDLFEESDDGSVDLPWESGAVLFRNPGDYLFLDYRIESTIDPFRCTNVWLTLKGYPSILACNGLWICEFYPDHVTNLLTGQVITLPSQVAIVLSVTIVLSSGIGVSDLYPNLYFFLQ